MTSTQKGLAAAAVVVVAIIVGLVVVSNGSDSSSSATDTTVGSTSTTASDGPLGSGATSSTTAAAAGEPTTLPPDPSEGGGTTGPTNPEGNSVMVPVENLPLNVTIDKKSGLSDGETVTVHVTAKGGSKIYGADARLCQGSATIDNSADFAPTQGGQCIAAPLSADSDAFVEVAAADPYTELDVPFRVGAGTSSYQMQDGTPVSISCGPGHTCRLVLKLQIEGGFGFASFDLSYG